MFGRIVAFGIAASLLALGGTIPRCLLRADEAKAKTAALGAETRIPTAEEAKAYGLNRLVECANGQYVKMVQRGGAAENAGIKQGDVLLSLNANKLYSGDDLRDFLRVTKPGTTVGAVVKRVGTFKEDQVSLTLESGPELLDKGIVWQYAGPGQMELALEAATRSGKPLLVGLAGSDT